MDQRTSAYGGSTRGLGNKVAIPKLERNQPPPPGPSQKNKEDRVSRACLTCRRRKVKCSGGLPQCTNCLANNLPCNYDSARRDRLKEAMRLNRVFEGLLREASEHATPIQRQRILDAIDESDPDLIARELPLTKDSLGKRPRHDTDDDSPEMHGEEDVTGSVGSNGEVESLSEDLTRNQEARDTGYIGQTSEVQWLRSLKRQAETPESKPHSHPPQYGPPGTGKIAANKRSDALQQRWLDSKPVSMQKITDSTFYLDADDIELNVALDPYELPDPITAELLFDRYLETVHTTFPLMSAKYEDQFRRFIGSMKVYRPFAVPDKWRAIMNTVFAIGAKHLQLTGDYSVEGACNHQVFMTRAIRLLGPQNAILMVASPDLNLVEATGFLALYFLVIGHVSKAWITIGISIRFAMALGLHLRNEDRSSTPGRKEALQTTWWTLHAIECLIISITGRPPIVPVEDCTVGYPEAPWDRKTPNGEGSRSAIRVRLDSTTSLQPVSQDMSMASSSTPGTPSRESYFTAHIHMTMIVRKVQLKLYAPRTAAFSWKLIEISISELLADIDEWASKYLLEKTAFETADEQTSEREHLLLHMYFLSTRMTITRPSLCRLDRRIVQMSETSRSFNSRVATMCVESAQRLAQLLPNQPSLTFVGFTGPWWSMVHIIMQALVILLLELVLRLKEQEVDNAGLAQDIKKLIRWLRKMSSREAVSARACLIVSRILNSSDPGIQPQINELFTEELHSWREEQEMRFRQPNINAQTGSPVTHSTEARSETTHTGDQPFMQPYEGTDLAGLNMGAFQSMQPFGDQDMPLTFNNPFTTSFDEIPFDFDLESMGENTWPVDQNNVNFFSTTIPESTRQAPPQSELPSEYNPQGQAQQPEQSLQDSDMQYSHSSFGPYKN